MRVYIIDNASFFVSIVYNFSNADFDFSSTDNIIMYTALQIGLFVAEIVGIFDVNCTLVVV